MGAAAATQFKSEEEALKAGKTQEEIDAWKKSNAASASVAAPDSMDMNDSGIDDMHSVTRVSVDDDDDPLSMFAAADAAAADAAAADAAAADDAAAAVTTTASRIFNGLENASAGKSGVENASAGKSGRKPFQYESRFHSSNPEDYKPVPKPTEGPLFKATQEGDVEQVRSLLASGIKPDAERSLLNYTPLMIAAKAGHTDVAIALVKAKADVNLKTRQLRNTPLIWAAYGGNTDIVIVLLKAMGNLPSKRNLKRCIESAEYYDYDDTVSVLEQARDDFEGFLKAHMTKEEKAQ